MTEMPKIQPAKAVPVRKKPAKSMRRGSLRCQSGSSQLTSAMPRSPIGTLIRKIQCQLQKVVMKPPTGGPTIGPISPGMLSQAMASTSWLRGVTRTSTSRATGVISAPPKPCSSRDSTKVNSEFEAAQATEPAMKMRIATRKTFRAPQRSAIQAEIGMKIASATR